MSVVRVMLISVGVAVVLVAIVIAVTVSTSITEDQVRMWFDAIGGVLSAAAAIVVALVGFRSQRLQALDAGEMQLRAEELARKQAIEQQRAQSEEARRMLLNERLWRERRPVYASILTNVDADNEVLINNTGFMGEVEAVGSQEVISAFNKWVDIWSLLRTRPNSRPPGAPAEEDLLQTLEEAADSLRDLVRRELGADAPLTDPQVQS
jgi:hypothetical protein